MSADRVRRVEHLKRSKGYGALIGVGGGILGALAAAGSADSGEEALGVPIVRLPMGAGVGTLIGAFTTRSHDVYCAPGPSGHARFLLAPVVTPRAKGLAVVYSF
jgi:tetrahydromethanopterin S-methyltransferase subunit C